MPTLVQSDFRGTPQPRPTTEYKFREPTNDRSKNDVPEDQSIVGAEPYEEANFEMTHTGLEIHEVPPDILATHLTKILAIESPIHSDILSTCLARLWGKNRAGTTIKDAVKKAVAKMVRDGVTKKLEAQGDFDELPSHKSSLVIRDRAYVTLNAMKYPDYIPYRHLKFDGQF